MKELHLPGETGRLPFLPPKRPLLVAENMLQCLEGRQVLAKTSGEAGWGMKPDTKKLSLNLSNCSLEEDRKNSWGLTGTVAKVSETFLNRDNTACFLLICFSSKLTESIFLPSVTFLESFQLTKWPGSQKVIAPRYQSVDRAENWEQEPPGPVLRRLGQPQGQGCKGH